MGRPEDRKEVLRVDCPTCHGNGYINTNTGQQACDACGGSGMMEKTVDYKYGSELRSRREIDEIFGFKTSSRQEDDE